MPVHRKKAPPRHSHPDLVNTIADELSRDSRAATPGVPEVYEEEQPYGDNLHVTVIWGKWSGVPVEERGAVILDAYEKAELSDQMRRITLAVGLTEEEAKKLNVSF